MSTTSARGPRSMARTGSGSRFISHPNRACIFRAIAGRQAEKNRIRSMNRPTSRTVLQLEIEAETGAIPLDALQNGDVDLRDAKRVPIVALGVEEASEESASIARAVALAVQKRVDDREPRQRPHLDLSERSSVTAVREGSYVGLHAEEPQVVDEARQRLIVDERDAPVRHRE